MNGSTARLLTLTDGVFAIAITLLVLNLTVPHVHSDVLGAVRNEWPYFVSYVLSFVVIGIIWANHHHTFSHIDRTNHIFRLINIVFLMWIAFLPFPTALLAEYIATGQRQAAVEFYMGTWMVGTLLFNLVWGYAAGPGKLLREDSNRKGVRATSRSYLLGPISYAVIFVVAFVSPIASLVLFGLLSVFYAVTPLWGDSDDVTVKLSKKEEVSSEYVSQGAK